VVATVVVVQVEEAIAKINYDELSLLIVIINQYQLKNEADRINENSATRCLNQDFPI